MTRTGSSSSRTAKAAYLPVDLAYYLDKRERGFDHCFIMLGADHHGYVGRMMAMCAAFGDEPHVNLEILIGQLVNLVKDGEPMRMSKRAGTVVSIDDLVEAIGVDAAAMRSRATAPTARSTSTSTCGHARPTTTPSSRCSTPTPGSRACCATRPTSVSWPSPILSCLPTSKEGELLRALWRVPAGRQGRGRIARAAPGGALHRGAGRDLQPLLHKMPDAAAGRRGGQRPPPGAARRWSRRRDVVSPTASACSASRPRSGCRQ